MYLGLHKDENINSKISKAISAYVYDNPQCYYVSTGYSISILDLKATTYYILELEYLVKTESQLAIMNTELENAINEFLDVISTTPAIPRYKYIHYNLLYYL